LKNIINIHQDNLPTRLINNPKGFEAKVNRLGPQIGALQIGCSVVEVPVGKKAWPRHSHSVNEEMFLILAGEGTLHYGEQHNPVREGDLISCPANIEVAHQIENTGTEPLKYLALGTQQEPEICHYPDSNKYGFYDNRNNNRAPELFVLSRKEDTLDYYDGE
jgi:uncharacterized cupin superfamily protein